jgi:hypothetical protein
MITSPWLINVSPKHITLFILFLKCKAGEFIEIEKCKVAE